MTELAPPLDVPAVASAAAIGDVAAVLTPPHRSPRALVVVLRVRAAVWLLGADAVAFAAGAVDFAVTLPEEGCVGWALTAAEALLCGPDDVATPWRGLLLRSPLAEPVRLVVPVAEEEERVAPLTVAEAEPAGPVAGVVDGGAAAGAAPAGAAAAGACVTGGVTGGATGVTVETGGVTVGVGGAAGVAGVPKPCGVQAQAMPAPTTATPIADKTVKYMMRARLCTGTLPR
jgi:hypothetical protein